MLSLNYQLNGLTNLNNQNLSPSKILLNLVFLKIKIWPTPSKNNIIENYRSKYSFDLLSLITS